MQCCHIDGQFDTMQTAWFLYGSWDLSWRMWMNFYILGNCHICLGICPFSHFICHASINQLSPFWMIVAIYLLSFDFCFVCVRRCCPFQNNFWKHSEKDAQVNQYIHREHGAFWLMQAIQKFQCDPRPISPTQTCDTVHRSCSRANEQCLQCASVCSWSSGIRASHSGSAVERTDMSPGSNARSKYKWVRQMYAVA